MKINDPFGRVSRRDQQHYAALKDRLQRAGIQDAGKLRQFTRNIAATLGRLLLLTLVVAATLALVFPAARSAVMLCAALLLIWLGASYVRTRLYLKKYLREECGEA